MNPIYNKVFKMCKKKEHKKMKRIFGFIVMFLMICGPAFAVTRNGEKVPTVTVLKGGYEVIGNGSKTVTSAGTAVQVSTTSVPTAWATLCASADNTGWIAVGGSTVKATGSGRSGITLEKNDCLTLNVDNLSSVYIDSTVNGESVNYVYQEYI